MKEPMIPGGYIMLSRKIIESEIWDKPPLYMKVWIYLLSLAQHTEYKGLKRGQLYTSIPKIREACSWYVGARKETPTAREVRNVLDWMRGKSPTKKASRKPFEQSPSVNPNSNMIVTTKVTHGMIVTIENYDVYQTSANYERHTERQDERQDETPLNSSGGSQYKQECIKNDKNDKELNTPRRKRREYEEDSPYMKMASYFLKKIREWKPDFVFRGSMQTWADDFRKIHELDKRSKEDIKAVIDWTTQDDFWQANVLSPSKLRKQFDTLQARMNREGIQHEQYRGDLGAGEKDSDGTEGLIINFGKYANRIKRAGGS